MDDASATAPSAVAHSTIPDAPGVTVAQRGLGYFVHLFTAFGVVFAFLAAAEVCKAQPDPRLVEENVRDDTADHLRGFDRSPEATPSTHLWRGALPTKLDAGEHAVEVRAFDTWRGQTRAKTTYRLAAP